MMCVVMLLSFLMALGVLTFNTYEIAQAQAFEQSIPTFGLYCEDEVVYTLSLIDFCIIKVVWRLVSYFMIH